MFKNIQNKASHIPTYFKNKSQLVEGKYVIQYWRFISFRIELILRWSESAEFFFLWKYSIRSNHQQIQIAIYICIRKKMCRATYGVKCDCMLFSLSIFIWKKRTYYYPDCIYKFLIFLFNVFLIVDRAEGGECCRAHYDANGFRHETMWCSHYCCQDRVRTHSPLYCCSDFFMRAERSDRLDFCSSWFSASSNL